MKVTNIDTGETLTLELYETGSTKNLAKKFVKHHARKIFVSGDHITKASYAMELFNKRGMTEDCFNEWSEIMDVAQAALKAKHDYLKDIDNELHPLIEMELASSYEKHLCTKKRFGIQHHNRDKKFGLKNAMDSELAIFNRLAYGVITVKDPVDNELHPHGANTSKTLNFKHIRHFETQTGDEWEIQVFCDFIMSMPDPKDSFEFTAGVEVQAHKENIGAFKIKDDEEWIFPFSMSFDQEQTVLATLFGAIEKNFAILNE